MRSTVGGARRPASTTWASRAVRTVGKALAALAVLFPATLIGGAHVSAAPLNCLPPEALTAAGPGAAGPARVSGVQVYMDGSGSMAGYLRGGESALADLLTILPATAAARAEPIGYARFGRRLTPMSIADGARFASPAAYTCPPHTPRAQCDNDESRLDLVLQQVARSRPDQVSVVVTDLWLDNTALTVSGPVALGLQLASLFQQGRSVDLIGVRARYSGPVFDMPTGKPYLGATERPLFVLLVGPVGAIQAYREAIETGGSDAFGPARMRHALFTAQPLTPAPVGARPLAVQGLGRGLREEIVLPAASGLRLQQFHLRRADALRERAAGRGVTAAGRFAIARSVRPGAVWAGDQAGEVRIWMLRDPRRLTADRCDATAWTAAPPLGGGWIAASGPGEDWRFVLDPGAPGLMTLQAGRTYLLTGRVVRTSLVRPNPADAWLREWSFDLAQEASVRRRKPQFFPTLNLAETTNVIEAALARAAAARPTVLAGFTIAMKVDG